MKKLTLLALLTTTSLGFAATAHADMFLLSYNSPSDSFDLTLTASGGAGGGTVNNVSGTYNGMTVNGLTTGGTPDNHLSSTGQLVDPSGISFTTTSGDVVTITPAGPPPGTYNVYDSKDGSNTIIHNPGLTLTSAPEPSQVISTLALAGMGGAALLVQRRRRQQA